MYGILSDWCLDPGQAGLASKHTGQGFQKGSTGLSDFSFLSPCVMLMGVGLHDKMERLSGR